MRTRSALVVLTLGVLVAVVFYGSRDFGPVVGPARVTAAKCDVYGGAPAQLVIEELRHWDSGELGVPLALAASDKDHVWALFQGSGRVHLLSPDGRMTPIGTVADTDFLFIAAGWRRLLAVRREAVFGYDQERARFVPILSVDPSEGRIASLAEDEDRMWIAMWNNRVTVLRVHDKRAPFEPKRRPLREWRGTGVRLHLVNHGSVVASRMRPPYTIDLIDSLGRDSWEAEPFFNPDADSLSPALPGHVMSVAVVPLDCGRFLQVLSDLRSDNRWLLVYSGAGPHPARSRNVVLPIGYVQAIPEERLLVGFDDSPERGRVVLQRWSWSATRDLPSQ